MRTRVRALGVLATAVGIAALAAAVASGPADEGLYVALGDSVPAGSGLADPSRESYPARLAAALDGLELADLARPGATSRDLRRSQLPEALDLIEEAAPAGGTRLVTVTIGGNDVVGPVTAACRSGPTGACSSTVDRQLAQVRAELGPALRELRRAAGPDTPIAVTTYHDAVVPPCELAADPEIAALAPVVLAGLIGVIRDQAGSVGAVVVETRPVVGPGDLLGDCLHPDAEGQAAIAEAVADALA